MKRKWKRKICSWGYRPQQQIMAVVLSKGATQKQHLGTKRINNNNNLELI